MFFKRTANHSTIIFRILRVGQATGGLLKRSFQYQGEAGHLRLPGYTITWMLERFESYIIIFQKPKHSILPTKL